MRAILVVLITIVVVLVLFPWFVGTGIANLYAKYFWLVVDYLYPSVNH